VNLEEYSKQELIDLVKKLRAKKKYGLVWEEEKTKEDFGDEYAKSFPVLRELEKYALNLNSNLSHFLIEGDNYSALQLLNFTHAGKIDLIYIDPPYNTGNDFKYNDKFINSDDPFRHSSWLSFMNKRLQLSYDLLTEDGFIFISIDDYEYAQLKLLCDEILGGVANQNYVGTLVWQRAKGGGNSKKIVRGHEYILVYCKGSNQRLTQAGNKASEHLKKANNPKYKDKYVKKDGIIYFINDDAVRRVFGKYEKGTERRCEYENLLTYKSQKVKDEVDELLARGEYVLLKQKSGLHYIGKLEPVADMRMALYSIIQGFLTEVGKNDLAKIGLEDAFDYPKPVGLMKIILDSIDKKDAVILDYFAGSGTTGQAVMELNAEDGGNRKFILVTNNEGEICTEVCYPRLKNVIKGYSNLDDEKIEGISNGLRYFQVGMIEKTTNADEMKMRLTEEIIDLIRLKEETFIQESAKNINFKIYSSLDKITAIYHSFDPTDLPIMRKEMEEMQTTKKMKIFVFSFDEDGLNVDDFIDFKNVIIEPIPKKLLELLEKTHA